MVRTARLFYFIPTLSHANEANYPCEATSTLAARKLDSGIRQSKGALQEPALLLLSPSNSANPKTSTTSWWTQVGIK